MSARVEWLSIGVLGVLSLLVYARGLPHDSAARDEASATTRASAGLVARLLAPEDEIDPLTAPPAPSLGVRPLSEGLPSSGHWRGNSVFADLDGDGHLDLFTSLRRWDRSTPGEGLHVWRGDGAGRWTPATGGLSRELGYGGTDVADLDGDGRLDLVFSGHDVVPHAYLGDGAGKWTLSWTAYDIDDMCADVAAGDFDNDGHADLAVVGFVSDGLGLVAYRGDGRGAFERDDELLAPVDFGAEVAADDLDGDGQPELLAATSAGPRVWKRTAEGWQVWSEGLPAPDVGGAELAVDAADLDGDGVKELLSAGMTYPGHPSLRVFRHEAAGWVAWGEGLPDDEAYFDAVFAHLDPTGTPAIVAAGKFGVSVVTMPQPGVFRRAGRLTGTEGVLNVCAGDVDGDGGDEIALIGFRGVQVLELADPDELRGAEAGVAAVTPGEGSAPAGPGGPP